MIKKARSDRQSKIIIFVVVRVFWLVNVHVKDTNDFRKLLKNLIK